MSDIFTDFGIVGITFFYVLLTIFIPLLLYKKERISKFSARKSVHLFAGLAILSSPFYFWPFWPTIIAGTLTVFVYFSSKESKVKQLKDLYDAISEEQEEGLKRAFLQGPFFYCLSITSLVLIFGIFAREKNTNYKLLKMFNPWLRKSYLKIYGNKTYTIKIPFEEYRKTKSYEMDTTIIAEKNK